MHLQLPILDPGRLLNLLTSVVETILDENTSKVINYQFTLCTFFPPELSVAVAHCLTNTCLRE